MEKVKRGYKILTPNLMSPYSPIKVQYSKNWTTPPSWLHGPLSVFRTLEDARSFLAWDDDPNMHHIWEVKYIQETTDRLRVIWYPKKESDNTIVPHRIPFPNYPSGRDFARAVKLIRRL